MSVKSIVANSEGTVLASIIIRS